ncbi:hypothetical protein [Nocardiopsis rhodophaea]|uniref:hypothetical protein n=1 Tax=Nocardiopsis rhodophaea TaxID=280238 RepID=UPI0031E4346C
MSATNYVLLDVEDNDDLDHGWREPGRSAANEHETDRGSTKTPRTGRIFQVMRH